MPKSDPHRQRVNHDGLEFDDQLALLGSAPFTGIAYSEYPDGKLAFQGRYREGLPEGLQEEWYPNGELFQRWIAVRGNGSSESWTWYPDGIQRSYRQARDGRTLKSSAWDEMGRPIDPTALSPDNAPSTLRDLFESAGSSGA